MNRKGLFVWSLYDFANSIIQINLLLYFSQWLVVDRGVPEIWYGAMYSFVTFLLLISSPILGVYSDHLSKKLPTLLSMSIVITISLFGLGFLAISTPFEYNATTFIVMAFFLVSNYFYQSSLIFFSSLLPSLGKLSHLGRMSGWGEFANNAGLIFGVLLTLPFVNGIAKIFGQYGRSYVFLPAAIGFFLFSLPFFIFFKEKNTKSDISSKSLMGLGSDVIKLIKDLPKFPSMMWFLIGFYFISDAVRTIMLFFPLYFEKVLMLSDSIKAILTMFSLFFMMIGALASGIVADKLGTKKTLLWLGILTIVFLLIFVSFTEMTLAGWIVIAIASTFMGGYFGVSRAMLIRLAKGKNIGRYFGLYSLFERFASILAPLLFGWSLGLFGSLGTVLSYKISYLVTFLLIIAGWMCFRKIREKDIA